MSLPGTGLKRGGGQSSTKHQPTLLPQKWPINVPNAWPWQSSQQQLCHSKRQETQQGKGGCAPEVQAQLSPRPMACVPSSHRPCIQFLHPCKVQIALGILGLIDLISEATRCCKELHGLTAGANVQADEETLFAKHC